MLYYADLHVHSKYSRATSRDCDLEHLAWWARRKGITVVGTGDFTHPAWMEEIRAKLVPAEPGLFRLRPELEREVSRRLPAACQGETRFLLEVEISTIYKKGEKTRKVHHLIYAPDLDTAERLRERLGRIGNLNADGRPILGLDSRHLLEITLESGPGAYLIPAHVWTPWFAVLGSKSGFDSVGECYGELAEHIFAVETGLSSDPPMNWRVSDLDRFTLVSNSDAHSPPMLGREACVFDTDLDYFALRRALETREGFGGTVEFFPEEGKYHLDGHRACGVRLEPDETRRLDGRCPVCGKPVTVGVMHRVEELADRTGDARSPSAAPFRSLVTLPEIIGELYGVGAKAKSVERKVAELATRLGPELEVLERVPLEEVRRLGDPLLTEALARLRAGQVRCEAGYDGEYGVVRLFAPGEIAERGSTVPLFGPRHEPVQERAPAPSAPAPVPEKELKSPAPSTPPAAPPPVPAAAPRTGRSLLDGLDPDQRAAAEIVDGPLLIVAGPGTGKTRTLTHRLAHTVTAGVAAPAECLALTFTRRAADEMRERLAALVPDAAPAITVATFHGLGLEVLRRERGELGLHRGFRVADDAERRALVRELFGLSERHAAQLLDDLGRARRARAWADEGAVSAAGASMTSLAENLGRYEAALRERDLVDFDDLLLLPLTLFAERPDRLAAWRERYPRLSIDEYQDVDALQYRFVRYLAEGPAPHVCAIGDPDQSIYRFRGADVGFFLRFRQDFPGARTVELRRNYRSTPAIVDAALQAIAPATLVAERELRAVTGPGAAERLVIHAAASERAEAEFVVHTIERLLGGTSHFSVDSGRVATDDGDALAFDDVAVLYRTDAQAAPLVEALERSGIPFQKRSHERLADRPGVRELLAELRTPGEMVSVRRSLDAALQRARSAAGADPAVLAGARELLLPLADRHGDDRDAFLAAIALGAEIDAWDSRAERVSLLTLHAAKGLEFPVVFIVGCSDGLVPLRWGESETADLDEERRLLFVGMTRARSRLFLTHSRTRRWRGKVREAVPSPFLSDIDEALLERRRAAPRKERPPEDDGPEQLSLL